MNFNTKQDWGILLSPTKTLDMTLLSKSATDKCPSNQYPIFSSESLILNSLLKEKTREGIQKIMKVSEKLSYQTYNDIVNFSENHHKKEALFAFKGAVFKNFAPENLTKNELFEVQNKIFIFSGLYGILRPFDLIKAHRLDMNIPLSGSDFNNLYSFWQEKIIHFLNQQKPLYFNLASKEFSKVLIRKTFTSHMITIDFKEKKDNSLKTVGTYAKMARGEMAKIMIQNDIKNIKDVTNLSPLGYHYSSLESSDTKLIFIR